MFTWLRLTAMGLRPMPHVGPHPGLWLFAALVAASVVAVADKGLPAMSMAPVFMGLALGPFVLAGAFARARTSLHTTRTTQMEAILQAYTDLHFEPGSHIRYEMMPMRQAAGGWVPDPGARKLHIWVDSRAHELPLHVALLCEKALSPMGFFAIPSQWSTHVAKPFSSAHTRMQAAARLVEPTDGPSPHEAPTTPFPNV